jgi:hypothetical protein
VDARARGIAARASLVLAVALLALACGGAQPERERPRAQPAGGGELAMREPGARPAAGAKLGALEPVAVREQPEASAQPTPPPAAPHAPIRVAKQPAPQPYPLRERALVMSGGLIVRGVPRGVTARKVAEEGSGDAVVELVDARGRRLALLKELAIARVALPGGPPLLGAAAVSREHAQRDGWGAGEVDVVVDRFGSETHLYTLERRARGTDWIWSGLELSPHGAAGAPQ